MNVPGWSDLPDWVKLLGVMVALGVMTYTTNQLADRYAKRAKGKRGFV